MIADNRTFIDRLKGHSLKQMRFNPELKCLKISYRQVDEVDTSALKFPPAARSGQYPVIVKKIDKAYGDHVVLKMLILLLNEEKSSLVGKNGEENLR
jgi:ATP-binding cassette subfamily F protein 3